MLRCRILRRSLGAVRRVIEDGRQDEGGEEWRVSDWREGLKRK